MHITKLSGYGLCAWLLLNQLSWADDNMSMSDMKGMDMSNMQGMNMAGMPNMSAQKPVTSDAAKTPKDTSSHGMSRSMDHGNAIYASTRWDNKWRLDKSGTGQLESELESWVGSDDNKLFVKAELDKTESEHHETELRALYSRNVSTFWDVQTGLRYRQDFNNVANKNATDFVVGVEGLAPYFFETEAYAYIGAHDYKALYLESSRDFLFTQKWIASPYVKALWVIQDNAKTPQKTGLAEAEVGVQTRYEWTKQIMPFVEFAYKHESSSQQTEWQAAEPSRQGWVYGAGLRLNF